MTVRDSSPMRGCGDVVRLPRVKTAFAFSMSSPAPIALEADKGESWVEIAKLGEWKGYVDDRGEQRSIKITPAHFASAISEFSRNENDMALDYEHQSTKGGEAPAAGWIDDLRVDGEKLLAHIAFTARAATSIRADEYRYTSPVWWINQPDRVTGETLLAQIPCVALTNVPFQDGLRPVSLSRALRMARPIDSSGDDPMEETQKLLDEVMAALGVTDPKTLLAAVQQLVGDAKADAPAGDAPMSLPAAMSRLKARGGDLVSMKTELDATRSALATANKAIADRKTVDEAESAKALESAAVAKVDGLISVGKAMPAQRDHYLAFARSDAKAFDALAATLPEIVPMSKRAKASEAKPLGGIDETHPVIASFRRSKWSDEKIKAYVARNPDQFAG